MSHDAPHIRQQKGFTLIELLIVVVIIGILAAIAIPKYASVRKRSYKATMMSDLKNLAHHQEVHHNETFTFSDDLDALGATASEGVTLDIGEADGDGWAAIATHQAVTGEQCGIYHGEADPANGSPASEQSVVECTY